MINEPSSHKHRLNVFWVWGRQDDKKAHLREVRDNKLVPYFDVCKNRPSIEPYYIKTDYYDCSYYLPENYCKTCKAELGRMKQVVMNMITVSVDIE